MATYKEIRGTQIEAVATDPSNPVEGQVWYNTTSNVLKGKALTASAAWSSGGTMNTARYVLGGGGSQTAAIAFGGARTPGPNSQAVTELYDGTSWTEVNDLNTAREAPGGAGTDNTNALAFGGSVSPQAQTEDFNGSTWSEIADLNTGRTKVASNGTVTAALAAGGTTGSNTAATEEWSGSSVETKVLTD